MSVSTSNPEGRTVEVHETSEPRQRRKRRRLIPFHAIGSGTLELLGAAGAITLVILALAGVASWTLTSIASISLGAALLGHGGVLAKRLSNLPATPGITEERAEFGEAAGDEILGGTAAIALGSLALIGLEPLLLLGVSAIALGGALVLSTGTRLELRHVARGVEPHARRTALVVASIALVLAGIAALTLGIIATVDEVAHRLVLIQIAFLCASGVLLASALLAGSHLLRRAHRERAVEAERHAPAAG